MAKKAKGEEGKEVTREPRRKNEEQAAKDEMTRRAAWNNRKGGEILADTHPANHWRQGS